MCGVERIFGRNKAKEIIRTIFKFPNKHSKQKLQADEVFS
jgi:hypothetical protein